jgi:hypothetical protein
MADEWVVRFTLQHGTTGRVARTFTEATAKRYAEAMNAKRRLPAVASGFHGQSPPVSGKKPEGCCRPATRGLRSVCREQSVSSGLPGTVKPRGPRPTGPRSFVSSGYSAASSVADSPFAVRMKVLGRVPGSMYSSALRSVQYELTFTRAERPSLPYMRMARDAGGSR